MKLDTTTVDRNGGTGLTHAVGMAAREAIQNLERGNARVRNVTITVRKAWVFPTPSEDDYGRMPVKVPVYRVSAKTVFEQWDHTEIPA